LFYTTDNIVQDNTFSHNGGFGNPTNGDLADLALKPAHHPKEAGNCFVHNKDTSATLTTWPVGLETSEGTCGQPKYPGTTAFDTLAVQAACATQLLLHCPPNSPGMSYPGTTKVKLKPLPKQRTMPNPCAGVPANPWCPSGHTKPYVSVAKRLSSGVGPPWPYDGIVALLAIAAVTWRRMRRSAERG
jgi:MYXO-CTERM domain-containing protein